MCFNCSLHPDDCRELNHKAAWNIQMLRNTKVTEDTKAEMIVYKPPAWAAHVVWQHVCRPAAEMTTSEPAHWESLLIYVL